MSEVKLAQLLLSVTGPDRDLPRTRLRGKLVQILRDAVVVDTGSVLRIVKFASSPLAVDWFHTAMKERLPLECLCQGDALADAFCSNDANRLYKDQCVSFLDLRLSGGAAPAAKGAEIHVRLARLLLPVTGPDRDRSMTMLRGRVETIEKEGVLVVDTGTGPRRMRFASSPEALGWLRTAQTEHLNLECVYQGDTLVESLPCEPDHHLYEEHGLAWLDLRLIADAGTAVKSPKSDVRLPRLLLPVTGAEQDQPRTLLRGQVVQIGDGVVTVQTGSLRRGLCFASSPEALGWLRMALTEHLDLKCFYHGDTLAETFPADIHHVLFENGMQPVLDLRPPDCQPLTLPLTDKERAASAVVCEGDAVVYLCWLRVEKKGIIQACFPLPADGPLRGWSTEAARLGLRVRVQSRGSAIERIERAEGEVLEVAPSLVAYRREGSPGTEGCRVMVATIDDISDRVMSLRARDRKASWSASMGHDTHLLRFVRRWLALHGPALRFSLHDTNVEQIEFLNPIDQRAFLDSFPPEPVMTQNNIPPVPPPPSRITRAKDALLHDGEDAAWRVAGSQFVKLTREPLVALLQRHLGPGDEGMRVRIAAFLETDLGGAMLTALLSAGLSALPSGSSAVPARMARELRVRSMAGLGDLTAEVLMGPLRQVMTTHLQGSTDLLTATPPAMGPRREGTWDETSERETADEEQGS